MQNTQVSSRNQIAAEYRSYYARICKQLGKEQLTMEESFPATEWARKEHRRFAEMNYAIDQKEKAEEARLERMRREGKKIIHPEDRVCRDCGTKLVKKPGRGRWPVKCGPCKGA